MGTSDGNPILDAEKQVGKCLLTGMYRAAEQSAVTGRLDADTAQHAVDMLGAELYLKPGQVMASAPAEALVAIGTALWPLLAPQLVAAAEGVQRRAGLLNLEVTLDEGGLAQITIPNAAGQTGHVVAVSHVTEPRFGTDLRDGGRVVLRLGHLMVQTVIAEDDRAGVVALAEALADQVRGRLEDEETAECDGDCSTCAQWEDGGNPGVSRCLDPEACVDGSRWVPVAEGVA
jgi:putative hemolysin